MDRQPSMTTITRSEPTVGAAALTDSPPAAGFLSWERYALGIVGLVGFAMGTCLIGLRGGPVMADHECIVAQSARQCVETGNWLIPYLGEIPRIRKTPLGIWLAGGSSYLFDGPDGPPVSAYAARMPAAVAGVANALLVCWLATMLFGRRAGLVAGFIASGCLASILYSRSATVEMLLTMSTTLSYALFWRAFMSNRPSLGFTLGFYAAFAAAMMAKFPLPLATVGFPLAVFWLVSLPVLRAYQERRLSAGDAPLAWGGLLREQIRRQVAGLRNFGLLPGLLLFVVLAGAWPVYAILSVDNALQLWKVEYADRFSGGLGHEPWYFYVPRLFALTIPYMLSLPEAIVAVFLVRYRTQRPQLVFALTWALAATVFLSCSAEKSSHYLASVMPAYSLLLAPVIDRLFFGRLVAGALAVRHACKFMGVLLIVCAAVGGIFVHKYWPAVLPPYIFAALVGTTLLIVATMAFAAGRRLFAFALFNLVILVAVTIGWPAMGAAFSHDPEVEALARGLRAEGVKQNDPVYWVGNRPDAAIEFYSGYRIRRLINELEMTQLREDRQIVDQELLAVFAERIRDRLAEPRPIYLVMSSGYFELMRRRTDIQARLLFRVSGFHENVGADLIVFTQPAATASSAATTPEEKRP